MGAAVGHHDLHRLQVVVGGVLEVLHGLHLILVGKMRALRGGGPHEEQLAEQHVALVDAGADERVQVHHAQLDVAHALFQALQAVGAEVLQADGVVQLGGVADHAVVDVGLDGIGVGRGAGIVQDGREEVPVAELRAAHRGEALEEVAADLALLHVGGIHDRAGGHDRREDPAPGDAVLGQAHVELVAVGREVVAARQREVGPQQVLAEGVVEVDAREGHLVAAVAVRQVLAVLGLGRIVAEVLGDGDVLFPKDVRRVGERPQQLALGQVRDDPLHEAVVVLQRLHRLGRRGQHRGVHLHLVLGEVAHDVHVVGEIGGGVGEKATAVDAQGFLLQAEAAFQKVRADRIVVGVQHSRLPRCVTRGRRMRAKPVRLRSKRSPQPALRPRLAAGAISHVRGPVYQLRLPHPQNLTASLRICNVRGARRAEADVWIKGRKWLGY